ncbi:MAG: DNA polymerase III subunit alpha [Spirochaetales bacterium]|nr:DNA polymerase III subunit alpha [Spirochaetales bacterium]
MSNKTVISRCSRSTAAGHPGPGGYDPLHCRSHYSFLKGVLSMEALCAHARAQGAGALGVCDVNGFYGVPDLFRSARAFGLKALAGSEIHFGGRYVFTLYALNREGFGRINQIITRVVEHQRLAKGAAPSPHISIAGNYDPVGDLLEYGWKGAAVASPHADLLSRLSGRSRQGLYMMLQWGRPFRRLVRQAGELKLPILALNRGIYLDEDQREHYRLLRVIDENSVVTDAGPALPEAFRLCSREEFAAFFSAVPDAVFNAQRLVRDAAFEFSPPGFIFPAFGGMTRDQEYVYLASLCRQGIRRRYGTETPDIRARLSYELSIIQRKGFAGYFLVVHDIVSQCPRTCGRGSSAASIVSYLLGITHVDPLAHNLFFERFLNMGRKDPPDIDVDFPWDERRKVLDYVFAAYRGRSGMVADHITFGPRSSIRDPARAFGLEEDQIRGLSDEYRIDRRPLPGFLEEARGWLKGIPRNLGTHPGGVVITPGDISRHAHIQISPLGLPVIPWEKDGTEEAGLVKIDLLGNRSLGVLRDTINLVNDTRTARGEDLIEWETFSPLDDPATRQMIEAGDTMGVFYVESPATRQLLKKMGCGDYPHLVVASSIIRPAANKYIHQYVERLRGAPYEPAHPRLGSILAETFGIMVYQEDVARVAIGICGFSPEEADGLRKILSKKHKGVRLDELKERFFKGAADNGVGPEAAGILWEGILSFEGYSFCKAHSASYALVSYRLGWLKQRYPLPFLVSVINNGGGFYSRAAYVNMCRRLGFEVRLPCVNASSYRYTVEGSAMRVGLGQLKGVRRRCIDSILEQREKRGGYDDLEDFLDRVRPDFSDMSVLVRSGALDGLCPGYNRPQMFWLYFHYARDARDAESASLFGLPSPPAGLADYSVRAKILNEMQTLDMLFSAHPLELFRQEILTACKKHRLSLVSSTAVPRMAGRQVAIAGILVTGKEVRTRDRREMCFVTYEDPEGLFETVIFPDRYGRFEGFLARHICFIVRGRIQKEFGVCILETEELIPITRGPGSRTPDRGNTACKSVCAGRY